jgi:hypothetical protein
MSESVEAAPRSAREGRTKLPYEAPTIAWEESWRSPAELMAACGKVEVSVEDCNTNGIAS